MITIKQEKVRLRGIIRSVYKKAGRAINDYNMIENNDRILVGVSGGPDSLSLLKILLLRKVHLPIDYKIIACFVDAGFDAELGPLLEEYFRKENIEYIVKTIELDKNDINCFWCSWNRRKALFSAARENNCNKIALAHHLDDISETILMNLFFHGEISSMRPKIELFKGKLSIIRPFCYLDKKDIQDFCSKFNFPKDNYQCPYASDSRRAVIKETILRLRKEFPHIRTNIFRALQRRKIKVDYLP